MARAIRLGLLWLAMVALQVAQFGLTIKPNYVLVAIIFLTATNSLGSLLGFSLSAGLVLDLFSGTNFGFNMAFYLLLPLLGKAVIRLDEVHLRRSAQFIVVVLATVTYNLLLALPYLRIGLLRPWLTVGSHVGLEILYNCIVLAVLILAGQIRHAKTQNLQLKLRHK